MRILLIEDELPAARQLSKLLLAARPACQILDTLDSVESAVRWLRALPAPDLVFMDIQIADGLSFDIFRQVEVTAPVVFTTAFDQYAVQAFKVNAVDYLLKPVDPEELEKALSKVENRRSAAPFDLSMIERFFKKDAYKDRFLVKTGQQMTFLLSTDIAFFRSADGLTQAFTFSGKKYFVEHTLEELERLLDPRDYFHQPGHERSPERHRQNRAAPQRPPQAGNEPARSGRSLREPGAGGRVQSVAGGMMRLRSYGLKSVDLKRRGHKQIHGK